MKNRHLLVIAGVIAIAVTLFLTRHKKKIKQVEVDDEEIAEIVPVASSTQLPSPGVQPVVKSGDVSRPVVVSAVTPPQLNEHILKEFSKHLKMMNNCLGLAGGAQSVAERTEPTVDNVILNLTKSIGDVAAQMDDWTQVEVLDRNSVRKRVRVDYDYLDGATATKRLSMYQINAYGMPEIMNLTSDQANNPNDAYIESLKEDMKIVADERGARAYFQNGEEMVFSTKNGQLQTLSVNKLDKSFNCFNLDQDASSCSCP